MRSNTNAARISERAEAGAKPESKSSSNNPRRFALSGLKRLCAERFDGSHYLPPSDESDRLMIAQLALGLSDDAAIGFGYWVEAELPELRRKALAFLDTDRDIDKAKKRTLGKFINMTTDEWVKHKLWQLGPPADQTPEELEEWWTKREKDKAKERSQNYRDERKKEREQKLAEAANPLDASVLNIVLKRPREGCYVPKSVAEIMEQVRKTYAFTRGMTDAALRTAIHKSLNRLEEKGLIGTGKARGRTGLRWAFIPMKPLYRYTKQKPR